MRNHESKDGLGKVKSKRSPPVELTAPAECATERFCSAIENELGLYLTQPTFPDLKMKEAYIDRALKETWELYFEALAETFRTSDVKFFRPRVTDLWTDLTDLRHMGRKALERDGGTLSNESVVGIMLQHKIVSSAVLLLRKHIPALRTSLQNSTSKDDSPSMSIENQPTLEGDKPIDSGSRKLSNRVAKAFFSYEWSKGQLEADEPTDKEVWKYLQESRSDEDRPEQLRNYPGKKINIETWSRYVRQGRNAFGKQKNSSRRGRSGRSIIRQEESDLCDESG